MGRSDNALTFAFLAVYGKRPPARISGRISPSKKWRDLDVDENIRDAWLEDLNGIKEIEIVSTEERISPERVAHIVFYMWRQRDDSRVQEIADKINRLPGEIRSLVDIGNRGRPRIVVARAVFVGSPGWLEFWESAAGIIKGAM